MRIAASALLLVDDPGVDHIALASAKPKIEQNLLRARVMHFALEPVNLPLLSRKTAFSKFILEINGRP